MYAGSNRRGSEKSEDTTMQVPGRIVHWKLNAFSVTVASGRIRRCLYNTFRACFRVTMSQPGVYRSISVVFVPYLRKFDRAEGLFSFRTGDIYLSSDCADVTRCSRAEPSPFISELAPFPRLYRRRKQRSPSRHFTNCNLRTSRRTYVQR